MNTETRTPKNNVTDTPIGAISTRPIFAHFAKKFHENNISIIPLMTGKDGKRPAISAWNRFCERLPTHEEIEVWVSQFPNGNIGLVCGPASRLVAVDIDTDDPIILEIIEKILPASPIRKRGKKGYTAFYQFNGDKSEKIKAAAERNTPPIVEILADGNQTVLPPSIHPDTNGPYAWQTDDTLETYPVVELPTLPRDFAQSLKDALGSVTGTLHPPGQSGRNSQLVSMATAAIIKQKTNQEISEELLSYDTKHHTPPLFSDPNESQMVGKSAQANALHFVESVRRSIERGSSELITGAPHEIEPIPLRRELGNPREYPVHALGELLGAATQTLADSVQAPLSICAQSILAAASLATQGYANVVIDGREYPLSEFFITIAESGERKSATDRIVMREFREKEKRLTSEYKIKKQEFARKTKTHTIKSNKLAEAPPGAENYAEPLDELPEAPLTPLFLCDDPTIEGIFKLTANGQPSIGLSSDEGGRMIGGHGMNQENQVRTVAGLSKFWDGDPISRVRAGDEAQTLYGRRLSMHLMAQPSIIAPLLANEVILGQGILNRVLIVFPSSNAGKRTYQPVDLTRAPTMLKFHERIRQIIELPLPLAAHTRNELEPRPLFVAGQAKDRWVQFYNNNELKLGPDGALVAIRGLAAKAPEHVLRLGGTLTFFVNPNATEISETAIQGAIELVDFYLSEALRLHFAAITPPKLIQAQQLLDWARKTCSRADPYLYFPHVYQYGPNAIRSVETATSILEILTQHGWIIPVPGGVRIKGQVRRYAWKVWEYSRNEP